MGRPIEFKESDVIRKALLLFWEKGYESTSLSDLLKATGLSKSSFYSSFGNKYEMFIKCLNLYRKERAQDMNYLFSSNHPKLAIEEFFKKIIEDTQKNTAFGCMSINVVIELAPKNDEIRTKFLEDIELIENSLCKIITQGQSTLDIKSQRPAKILAKLLTLSFPGLQVMVRSGATQQQLNDSLKDLLSILD